MNLTKKSDAFFYIDQYLDDVKYRIFSYRLASYSDFCEPDALESRGIMFDVTVEDKPVLVCRPFKKFFNYGENPFTMNLDYSKFQYYMDKLDGSLISTYMHKGKLMLKTKQSIFSEQAVAAMDWLDRPENSEMKMFAEESTRRGLTVNFEYTSPMNRVVVGYDTTKLTVIGGRSNATGELADMSIVSGMAKLLGIDTGATLPFVKTFRTDDPEAVIKNTPSESGIEGYVFCFQDQLVKVKTDWYVSLHRSRESIDIPRRLFDCVIDEAADDLKQLFSTDEFLLNKIKEMEEKVIPTFNSFARQVSDFVSENKDLSRKDFAIKGQKELSPALFKLVMQEYLGKPLCMKEWAKKNVELFGIREG